MKCNLTQKQRDILIGLLLGDGNLEFNKFKGARLQIKQAECKEEYVLWLYEQFKDIVSTPPKQRQDTKQWYFGTKHYEDLEEIRQMFYREKKKVLPHSISELVTDPITLAVWYMDDGRLDYRPKSHYAYSFSTDSFTIEEVEILKDILQKNFGIASSIQNPICRGKRYPKLYIGKEGRDIFTETINQFILPCFAYKLPSKL